MKWNIVASQTVELVLDPTPCYYLLLPLLAPILSGVHQQHYSHQHTQRNNHRNSVSKERKIETEIRTFHVQGTKLSSMLASLASQTRSRYVRV